jgi:hypothetical protein
MSLAATGVLVTGASRAFASSATGSGFEPLSVTFVSLTTGWALGRAPCRSSGECLALFETTDTGRSWSARSLPASLLAQADRKLDGRTAGVGLNVRFADPSDGWIFGGIPLASGSGVMVLWSTHDGGQVWHKQTIRAFSGGIFDLEAGAGWAHAMAPDNGDGVAVESSPVSRDSWRSANKVALGDPAGGGEQSGSIVLQGGTGWLVEGNDRGTTGSARLDSAHQWAGWTPPCANVGGSFAVPAASSPHNLVAVCVMGGYASPMPKAAPRGATLGSTWLYTSDNGGMTFRAAVELSRQGYVFDGVLASPAPGVVFSGYGETGTDQELLGSFNGGHNWSVVYRGDISYLGFTSPSQGVAIVQLTNGTTRMIMSFNGGRSWAAASF